MASCQTARWQGNSPYVKLVVEEISSKAATSELAWALYYISDYPASTSVKKSYTVTFGGNTVASGTYDINKKTGTYNIASGTRTITKTTSTQTITFGCSMAFNLTWSNEYGGTKSASGSISVGSKPSYTITYYANGGSSTPSAQTRWYGTTITLAGAISRTGHSFASWNTNAAGTGVNYAAGSAYSTDASISLYAKWTAHTYTVSYNANGGSGAPGNQTKTYGVNLTLSSTRPTRTNYNFLGWSTSSTATSASYQPGGTYTNNSAITLYAVWQLAYVKPRVSGFSVDRCDSSGTLMDDGTYALVKFKWVCDRTVSSIKIQWKLPSSSSYTNSTTVSASGTTGNVSAVVGSGALDPDHSYDFYALVTDGGGSTYRTGTLAGMSYVIDILDGSKGTGVAIGKPAETPGVFDCQLVAKFNGDVYGNVFGFGALPGIAANSDFNSYVVPGGYAVGMDNTAATISNIPVNYAGRLYVMTGTGGTVTSIDDGYAYLIQLYITYRAQIYIRYLHANGTPGSWTYGAWKTVVS